jgi:predicted metal-dependent hydrolase
VSLRSLSHRLRKRFPGVRVTVRRVDPMRHEFAITETDDAGGYVISIDKHIREDFAAFILAHEFAHVVDRFDRKQNVHGPTFWQAYQDCFDVYVAWCRE